MPIVPGVEAACWCLGSSVCPSWKGQGLFVCPHHSLQLLGFSREFLLSCFLFYLQGDVWICMELMDTSLDKFYKKVLEKKKTIPEDILGKMAVSVSAFWVHTWFCAPPRPCSDAWHPSRVTLCWVLHSRGLNAACRSPLLRHAAFRNGWCVHGEMLVLHVSNSSLLLCLSPDCTGSGASAQ